MTDVKPFLLFSILHWQMLLPSLLWQILLPICMADVIVISVWWMLLPLVFVIYFISKVADVIAFMCVVDGKTTCYLQIILADIVAKVADRITTQGG